jgi:phage terminase large subunit-like protein
MRGIELYRNWRANRIVAEVNYGGDMVAAAFNNADASVAVEVVTASRGKLVRAEPVQQLYERGLIHHVGIFSQLESEMCRYDGTGDSPNRMDALVWAVTDLMLGAGVTPFEYQEASRSTLPGRQLWTTPQTPEQHFWGEDATDGDLGSITKRFN